MGSTYLWTVSRALCNPHCVRMYVLHRLLFGPRNGILPFQVRAEKAPCAAWRHSWSLDDIDVVATSSTVIAMIQ